MYLLVSVMDIYNEITSIKFIEINNNRQQCPVNSLLLWTAPLKKQTENESTLGIFFCPFNDNHVFCCPFV